MVDSDSTSGKAPAFQFYPKDFLADENVRVMSLQERGAYITLLSLCWIEGTLPADVDRLARLCGTPTPAFRKLWPALEPCFRAGDREGRLVHPRLERERVKQREFNRRQSDNGRKGGRPRKPNDNPNESQKNPSLSSGLTQTEPKKSSAFAVCSLQSSDSGQRESAHAAKPRAVQGPGAGVGTYPRDHLLCHQPCIRVCVSEKQHAILRERHGGSDADLDAFYADVRDRLDPSVPIGERPWQFWETQFSARFGTLAVNPKTAGNVAAAAQFIARGQS